MIRKSTLSSSFLRHTWWQEQAKTKQSKTKRNKGPSHTRWAGKPAVEPRQNNDVYNYTTNLQIVHMFKDPLTSGSDWEGSPSSMVFDWIYECTKQSDTYTKQIENRGKALIKTKLSKSKQNSISFSKSSIRGDSPTSSWNTSKMKLILINQNMCEMIFFVFKSSFQNNFLKYTLRSFILIFCEIETQMLEFKTNWCPRSQTTF